MAAYLPTLKQLQYLVALKEYGHFGRAAAACFVTQSTLSGGIKELETVLDASLVERTRRVVRFTELGNGLVAKAHRVLREAEELAEMARSAGQPLVGDIRMSVIPTIAPFLLPRLLPQLRQERPELRLYLKEETSKAACESLRHGHIDCVLLANPFPCGEVDSVALFHDELLVAFPQGEPLDPPLRVDPAFIDETRLLLLEDGHCLKDHALAVCNRPELMTSARMTGTSLHTLVQMVDNGLGLTLLPKMAIDSGILERTKITARRLTTKRSYREIALVWRKNSPRGDEFSLLADIMRQSHHWVNAERDA